MIIAVAIKQDGLVYPLPKPFRHHHIINTLAGLGFDTPIIGEQGFVDDELGFLGRAGAYWRAKDTGQLEGRKKTGNENSAELYSEDLW